MQKIIFLLILLIITTTLKAQDFQGKAYYQTKRAFDLKMDSTKVSDPRQDAIKKMLRKQFEKTYILTFNKTTSIYKQEEKLETPQPQAASGMVIELDGLDNTYFKNTKTKTFTNEQETFGKQFLIKDKLKNWDWKLEKESKKIGNYLCFKATTIKMVDDYKEMKKLEKQKELKVIAWYTPEIPVSNGPENYQGLPGLILELHEGKMHFVCAKLVLNPKEKMAINEPKKGKEINQEDYDKMMDKKHKEMMSNFQNGRKKGDEHRMTIRIGG